MDFIFFAANFCFLQFHSVLADHKAILSADKCGWSCHYEVWCHSISQLSDIASQLRTEGECVRERYDCLFFTRRVVHEIQEPGEKVRLSQGSLQLYS